VLGGAAAWPLAARAQQPDRVRRIGLLIGASEENDAESLARITAFRQGLEALGWTEGRNIRIDYRFGGGDAARIQTYAAELVNAEPDVIVANSAAVVAALKHATSTIPIVCAAVNDPVEQGFVASLARPGGNITGFIYVEFPMLGKWLELLKEMVPSVRRAALLFNPETTPYYPVWLREFKALPQTPAVDLVAAPVHNESEIETAIVALAGEPGGGLIAASDPFNTGHRGLIMTLAKRHRVPAVYGGGTLFAAEGGLMTYGPDFYDIFRRSASYVDRILRGEKPADLPVQAPTKYELAINLKTAKALGLTVPSALLARADEVIE
jgi:putative ABC transport system substrate-binding protein